MGIFNYTKLAEASGLSRLKLWRWFTSRYANITEEQKDSVIKVIEKELEEIKKK